VDWDETNVKVPDGYKYGLLVLESVNYCCSLFDRTLQEIIIFFSGITEGGAIYLGAYMLSIDSLSYKNFNCTHDNGLQDFLWRPPAFPTDASDSSDTPSDSILTKLVVDNYDSDDIPEPYHDLMTIIASEATSLGAQVDVDNVTDFGIISVKKISDGIIVLFFDSLDGIEILFSRDSGQTWGSSEIIIVQNGQSAVYTGGLLIYITSTGIVSKLLPEVLLSNAFDYPKGSSGSDLELLQKTFNEQKIDSLKTGEVPVQKLSAHTDDTGSVYVFIMTIMDAYVQLMVQMLIGSPILIFSR